MGVFSAVLLFSCVLMISHVAADKKNLQLCSSDDECRPKPALLGTDCSCIKTTADYGYCKCVVAGHYNDCNTHEECDRKFGGHGKVCYCSKYDPQHPGECSCEPRYGK